MARVIEAVQALRGWRDFAGVQGRGHRARAARRRGLRGDRRARGAPRPAVVHRGRGRARGDASRCRAARSRSCPRTTSTSEGAERRLAARAGQARGRDRAGRAQAGQPGLRGQGAAGRRPGRARQARRGCEAESSDVAYDPRGGRALHPLPRAVRDAVRPGPHAAADDRDGQPAAALRLDPRGGDQRQVLDRADDRGDPQPARPAHRRLPVAPSGLVRRADPGRRRRSRAGAVRRRGPARRARRRTGRPLAGR